MNDTWTGTITPDQSGPASNSDKKVFHIVHSFRTGALPSDSVLSHTQIYYKYKKYSKK